ncbi:MAG: prepilin peptidase [Desulfovibrio sp.]
MHPYLAVFVLAALGASVFTDLREQRIPNSLTLSIALFGILFHSVGSLAFGPDNGAYGALFALAGLGAGLVLMLPPYLFGVMGGGDVKLMAAIGACLGWRVTVDAFLFASLAGGVYALVVLLLRHRPMLGRILKNFWAALWLLLASRKAEYAPVRGGETLPRLCYGLAIAAGTGAAMLRTAENTANLTGLFAGIF